MSSDSRKVALGDIVDITSSKRIFRREYVESGVPFYRGKEIIEKSSGKEPSTDIFITEERFNQIKKKHGTPQSGEILLTSVGTLGVPYQVQEGEKFYFKDGNLTWIKDFGDEVLPEFILVWLKSPKADEQIRKITIGSTQQALTITSLKTLELDLPTKVRQRLICDHYFTLSDKIELNRQTNETLEAMAQVIFKSWFVDFDPVRAKIEAKSAGRDPSRAAMATISGISLEQEWDEVEATLDQKLARMSETQRQQLTRTAQLFPDELVGSEIGEVPKGWGFGNLGEICSVQGGYAFKSKLFKEEGYPVVKIKNINEDYTVDIKNGQFLSEEDTIDKETYELNDGDYVLAMTGATVGKTGIIVSNSEKVMLNQRVAKFESDQFKGNISWFIHSAFLATNMKEQIVNLARGSAQPNISASGIESAELIIPSKVMIDEFLKIADPLFKKWIDNYKQNETLSSLRDTLLPKLISGEVGV